MEPSSLNLEQLGVSAIIVVLLIVAIKWLISEMARREKQHEKAMKEAQDAYSVEREYSKELGIRVEKTVAQFTETMTGQEAALKTVFSLIKDLLK